MKKLALFLGLVVAVAAAAGSAFPAGTHGDRTIVATVQDIGFVDPTAKCEEGTITFSLVGLDGRRLGRGGSCIHRSEGCLFAAGCRRTVHADFKLRFASGKLKAPVVLRELWTTDAKLFQRTRGEIRRGTGAFAGAEGSIRCLGTLEFTEVAVVPDLVCVIRIR
jgi:hypothetical protein